MPASLLEGVRTACAEVAAGAAFVRIDRTVLPAYAAALPAGRLAQPQMDPACHFLGQGEATVAFILTLDAINFGSGYFPEIFGPQRSGYFAIASALTERFAREGPLTATELARLDGADCAALFRLDATNPAAAELAGLFACALNELGAFLVERCGGDFTRLVAAAAGSAERLVELLATLPSFNDVALWRGRPVPFYKRAQLAAVDLHLAFAGEGYGHFTDLDHLTACADNLLPHVLRWDGLLVYEPALAERIDRGEPLAAGSAEEVELRASAVHACELLVNELRHISRPVNALLLDNLLWHRGQKPFYRARPRHRTRTIFY